MRLRNDLSNDVQAALREAERMMGRDSNIHSVGWGEKLREGNLKTGKNSVVFGVKDKKPRSQLTTEVYIPGSLFGCPTDVVERPAALIELLGLLLRSDDRGLAVTGAMAARNVNQQCHQCPVPGGIQIQPDGKSWVGTLGCKVVYQDATTGKLRHGAITNWHVATGDIDRDLHQPTIQKPWVGFVARSPGVSFSETNRVDLSILDIQRVTGDYAPLTHCVKPEQLTLGAYSKELSTGGIGTVVARDGRTLGRIDNGQCIQIGATIRVGYGGGKTALFTDQFIISRPDGDFSAPGDSGSMVFEYPAMRPFGLLFAGGGGVTIVSPAEYVLTGGVHSFQ